MFAVSSSYRIVEEIHDHRLAAADGAPQVDPLGNFRRQVLMEYILEDPPSHRAAAAPRGRG
jgi:hypothetical protein